MHTIDIISDVSCPWCIIGYQSLRAAIDELGKEESITLNWKPFELNPAMGPEGQDRAEHIQQKYGLTPDQSRGTRQNIVDRGLEVGYEFSFVADGRIYNTFNAHRLLHWAKDFGLQTELKLALFDLYFQQGGNPADKQQLLECAEAVGLPSDTAAEVLESELFTDQVRTDQQWAQQQGISAVPTFIFDNKYLVSGGQPSSVFVDVLQQLEKELSSELV